MPSNPSQIQVNFFAYKILEIAHNRMMIHLQGGGSNFSPALSVILVHWDGMKKADPNIGWPALASVTVDDPFMT